MTREEIRLWVVIVCGCAALYAAAEIQSETLMTVVMIVFSLAFLAHIRWRTRAPGSTDPSGCAARSGRSSEASWSCRS
jgi:hypothetical protein